LGTLLQELNSLELIVNQSWFKKEETLRRPTEAPEETKKKQLLPNRLTEDRELEMPIAANRAVRLMSIPGSAVAQKDLTWWDTSGYPEPSESY